MIHCNISWKFTEYTAKTLSSKFWNCLKFSRHPNSNFTTSLRLCISMIWGNQTLSHWHTATSTTVTLCLLKIIDISHSPVNGEMYLMLTISTTSSHAKALHKLWWYYTVLHMWNSTLIVHTIRTHVVTYSNYWETSIKQAAKFDGFQSRT